MSRRVARAEADSPGRSDNEASIALYRSRAVEQCRDLHARALERVACEGWRNGRQAHASAESVANVMCQLEPGARIAIAGMKFFPWWAGPLNLLPWLRNRPDNMRAADLWQPWDIVQAHCDVFEWQATQWGMGYIGCGRLRLRRCRRP